MGADNVDLFKNIIFRIPPARTSIAATVVLGLLYGALFFVALDAFAQNLIPASFLKPALAPLLGLTVFILPSLVSGEALYQFLPDYPRKWGYFLALCNQSVIFIYSLIFSGADTFANAWSIVWLGLATVFLSNFLILLLTLGYDYVKRVGPLSTLQPLAILAAFHLMLGRFLQIPLEVYLMNLGILVLAGALLFGVFGVTEYLLAANISNVSVLSLASALLQKKQEALDLGYLTRPEVQTLEIENQQGNTTIAVPWIHPGPLEGFGGGRITSDIIEQLNQDGKGFFFHVPSTHKSDPANPGDYQKILDAMGEPEKYGEASKLVKKDYEGIVFYGRKVDGKKIVYMYSEEFDDYEMPIFNETINQDETLLVDLHCDDEEEDAEKRIELWYNTERSQQFRQNLKEFLEVLDGEETYDYSAGTAVNIEEVPKFGLVEQVKDQKTLMLGIESNGITEGLKQLRQDYQQEFDQILLFTTDTHRSIHDLSSHDQVDTEKARNVIEEASEDLSDAGIGFTSRKAKEMKLLQEDYHSLVFSINILVRLILLSLVAIYVALVIWLF